MDGRRLEYRIQVDGIHPQILQIVEFVDDPLEIAAVAAELGVNVEAFAIPLPWCQSVAVTGLRAHLPAGWHEAGPSALQTCGNGIIGRIAITKARLPCYDSRRLT